MPQFPQRRHLHQDLVNSLFAVVFPTSCSVCGGEVASADGLGVCRECWHKIEPWGGVCCERCGLPIVSARTADSSHILCGACLASAPDFDCARVFGVYRGNLRELILQLKFRRRERLGRRLGALLVHAWRTFDGFGDSVLPLIVPVPLFHSRERERGFNQARLLAEGLVHHLRKFSNKANARVEAGVLRRTRPTLPQTGLKYETRKENVRDAFAVAKPRSVLGRHVVLVDDVMTTGATLSACASTLKKGGAGRVLALAMARATPQFPDTGARPGATGVDEFDRQWR